jgi:excisionase family DNA binding protein
MVMNSTVSGLSIATAAKRAGVTARTVWAWIHEGVADKSGERVHLKASKLGRKWLIDPADLDEFSRRLTEAALSK